MPLTSDNITAHELIGLRVGIVKASDPTLRGLEGIVRDETRNTLCIEARGQLVRISKENASFTFEFAGQSVMVQGSTVRFRPEDRVKRGMANW